jgi:hypothetical protein
VSDDRCMSTISPGPATNSSSPANAFEVKATDPQESGKEVTLTKGQNAAAQMAAHTFEQRAAEAGGIQH